MNERAHGRGVLWLTLLLALLLQIMPMPELLAPWRPDWLLLTVVYWVLALPHRFNILSACLAGIVLDVLLGATLGVRGFALAIVAFMVAVQYQKLRHFTVWHQLCLVGIFALISQAVIIVHDYLGNDLQQLNWALLKPALLTAALWPWAHWLLGQVRRRFKIR
ncbi:rod shape-determining protein MreD [Ferrimonas senticii]|uniref:rod shape-determining protein MreD n=1 Tax=Ferrimonas senticii TaxID=394566 RepID=UPI00041CBC44|nr:rod shape-determining protein MreD [Ferrimonas senticii]